MRIAAALAVSTLALAGCGPVAKAVTKVVAGSGDEAVKAARAAEAARAAKAASPAAAGAAHAGSAADEAGGIGREVAGEGVQQGAQYASSPGGNRADEE
jgi:hypothetical protein